MTVSNIEYDILTVLQSKLEAVAAYEKYLRDCGQDGNQECRQLLEEIKRDDEQHAQRLREQLKRLVSTS